MAFSKCPFCENTGFELTQTAPTGSAYRLYFVQCSRCGAPFSTQEFNNIGATLEKQNVAIKKIAQQLGVQVDL